MFEMPDFSHHEEVALFCEPHSGLRLVVAIHNTSRGPAMGGCRMWPYASTEAAIADALRLSAGMTYKAALAQLPCGGGKSVIIGDPARDKTGDLIQALGRAVDSLRGRYTISDDVGIGAQDIVALRAVTPYVAGPITDLGELSPATAWGLFHGIRAAAAHVLGRDDLRGVSVAVQGLGAVGYRLCAYLAERNARLIVSDLKSELAIRCRREFGARVLPPEEILFAATDILAPCAFGGVLNDETIPRLRCRAIAGAANNQLQRQSHGRALHARGITYAPDYVINVGGLIDLVHEQRGNYSLSAVLQDCERIYHTTLKVLARAQLEDAPPNTVANQMAEEQFTMVRTRFDVTASQPCFTPTS